MTEMKSKAQFIFIVISALLISAGILFAFPSASKALTSDQQLKVAQTKTEDLEKTVDKGVVQCGNDDNISKGTLGGKGGQPTGKCTINDLFNTAIRVINALMLAAAVFAVIRIVMAGGQMVISGGNQERLTAGKSGLTNALIGLVIVIASYLIINTVLAFLVPDTGKGVLSNPLDFINTPDEKFQNK